jgi:hypothetical protein
MVTAPENNRNVFILKPLLDEVVELVMCSQMKIFTLAIQHVTANETVLVLPANETHPRSTQCYYGSLRGLCTTIKTTKRAGVITEVVIVSQDSVRLHVACTLQDTLLFVLRKVMHHS